MFQEAVESELWDADSGGIFEAARLLEEIGGNIRRDEIGFRENGGVAKPRGWQFHSFLQTLKRAAVPDGMAEILDVAEIKFFKNISTSSLRQKCAWLLLPTNFPVASAESLLEASGRLELLSRKLSRFRSFPSSNRRRPSTAQSSRMMILVPK